MPSDTKVTVYYGPLSWFDEQVEDLPCDSLMEIVYARDEVNRQLKVIVPGQQENEPEERERSGHVVAESGDYASLNEHAITNFAGFIRSIDPECLHLHNPPAHVHAQMERTAKAIDVKRYEYPMVTRDTLIRFRNGFGSHLVGQAAVKETLLAALYPLTTRRRTKPVVLMFYGPSGVGKTETAQFVNDLLGGTLLRKQFSMFHSDKFASYLFGGMHGEPSFAHDLLDRESGVILIDEFDKANSVFHSAFYQLFDSGVFEDKNYSVKIGPSLIICTSNYGSQNEIREALGDALYSRFDSLVAFEPLSRDEILQVVERVVKARFAELSYEEQKYLDVDFLMARMGLFAENSTNVRKLGKIVEELISLILVRALLREEPELE
ncbi:ATP-dependent Clp protease ATP-binding subunit [Micromonospora sp. H61]|nr:ATP-dependent Clp protease ATP-binding subunit [Micromonospora sp. H61]